MRFYQVLPEVGKAGGHFVRLRMEGRLFLCLKYSNT